MRDQTDKGSGTAAPPNDPATLGIDAERARLIGSIYDVVLEPESFDSFMSDWSAYVDQAMRRLGDIRVTAESTGTTLDDPVIEVHFSRAFALFERMGRGEADMPLAGDAGTVLLRMGRGGAVLDCRPEAETLFGPVPHLGSIRAAFEPDSAARLSAFLAAFERAPSSGRFAVLSLVEAPGPRTLPGGGLVAVVTCRAPSGEGFIIEFRPLSIGWNPALETILASAFALTPRETVLVHALSEGSDLTGIAAQSGRSMNTLRAQLKSVFAKTRTRSQSELMRLVAALVLHGPDADPMIEARPEPGPEPGRETLIDTGDGRLIPVYQFGPPDGIPVVFLHAMLEGLGVTGFLEPTLTTCGLRLIAPVRANYGQAPADPRIKEAPDVTARDIVAILDHLGIDRAVLCGHMGGAIYAFAAAARLGQRVLGIANVAGCVPLRSVEQFARMTPRQRAVAYTARFAPAFLPAILRAGIAQIDSAAATRFMTSLYPEGSPDHALIQNPAIGAALIDGYRFTVAQGLQAFRTDAYHVTRDWSANVLASDCPVLLIQGVQDTVITIESVRDFAATSDRFTLIEEPTLGQLLFYEQPASVLNRIAAFARAQLAERGP